MLAWPEHPTLAHEDDVAVSLNWPRVNRDPSGQSRQAQARNGELAAPDRQNRGTAAKFNFAPAPPRGPEIDRIAGARGLKADFISPLVESQSDIGVQEGVARQRAGVVTTA